MKSSNPIEALYRRKSTEAVSLQFFMKRINEIFHDIEAAYYDNIHQDMWNDLPPIFRSYDSLLNNAYRDIKEIRLLDVGCGTGLSTEILLENSEIKNKIEAITLLDSSAEMLKLASARIGKIHQEIEVSHGYLDDLDRKYDFILCCSVLHHIPDLDSFFKEVDRSLKPGGHFFHLHDPNGDYIKDEQYLQRLKELSDWRLRDAKNPFSKLKRFPHKVRRLFAKKNENNYIAKVNNQLQEEGIILTELTAQEIWSVTDIHVEDLPFSTSKGISIKDTRAMLSNFSLIKSASYAYYGEMCSLLPPKFQLTEKKLFNQGYRNGRNISALWQKSY